LNVVVPFSLHASRTGRTSRLEPAATTPPRKKSRRRASTITALLGKSERSKERSAARARPGPMTRFWLAPFGFRER
jgi:hypothetical protein